MRFRVASFLASITMLAVAGCSGGSSAPTAPTITWTNPSSIVYGTALSSTQLDATASVPGMFAYSPAAGTVPKAGSQTLSVTFTPTDTKYTTATATVTLTVTQATPAITWATPASIAYGTALGAAQLDATAGVPGVFVYSPAAGQVPAVGNQTLSVTFSPTDNTDYTTANASVTLAVSKGTPAITWTAPGAITYGTALSATQLDATASVPGMFVYTPAIGTVVAAGQQTLSASFTPTDTTDYNTPAAQTVQLTVNTAALTVTCASTGMTYGSTVPGLPAVVTGVVAGDGITASCSTTATSSSPVGSYPITATLNDPSSKLTFYSVTNTPGTLTVSQATPVITWAAPAAIIQGTALSATQLDATASVPGSFVYTPASGTVLNTVGTTQLSTTFTPTDAVDYTTATDTVSLTVNTNQPAVAVDFGAQDQLIRGFGGSTAWLGTMPQAVATSLFDPVNGLGLSILRVRIDPTGSPNGGGASGDPYETGEWDQEAANGAEALAANPNAIVFATPWTPPALWKLNGSSTYTDPGSSTEYNETFQTTCSPAAHYCGGYLDPNHYADYAAYLEDFVSFFNTTNGFNLYAISMQNEPEENVTYESCIWSPLQMDTWVAGNASVITADPTYPTKLIMPEADSFQPAQALTALEDPNAENLISIIGGHLYGVSPAPYTIPAGDSPKEIWMTEYGPLSSAQLTFAQALSPYAISIHNSMVTGQYNAYVWWGVFGDSTGSCATAAGTCGLVDDSGNVMTMGYVMGQYSKFIQPGYYRYNATAKPSASVFVSAYAGTQGTAQHYVIVAINASTSAVSQPFTIANATVNAMTPYQSTASGGLAPQSEFTVNGNAFTYTLPAQSITTFVQ